MRDPLWPAGLLEKLDPDAPARAVADGFLEFSFAWIRIDKISVTPASTTLSMA